MSRRFVTELTDGETVDQVFLAAEKQLRPNRTGSLYLQIRLSDRTGSITSMMWNADQKQYESFANGDFLRIKGNAQFYNGNMQVIVKSMNKVDAGQVDRVDFETVSSQQIDELAAEMAAKLREMRNYHLRNLAESILIDEELMRRLRRAPAGVKNHHAYQGGLLAHILSLMRVAAAVGPLYDELDDDLLLMGVVLHDLGKIEELTYESDLGYSDAGQLLGHIVQGIGILERKIAETEKQMAEPFPLELGLRLKHMVVSHHGDYEFGSPKLPMTFEAIALHYLDNLDAKIANVRQLIAEDANASSNWTSFNPQLGRKILKGPANKGS
jgi:3'-5' exoribonuclease